MKLRRNKQQARNRPQTERSRGVFSYYNTRASAAAVPRAEKNSDLRTYTKRLRLLPTIVAAAVIVGSILFSLTLSSSVAVQYISDVPSYRTEHAYSDKMAELLQAHIGSRTKVTINTDAVETAFLEAFPEVAAVQIRLPVLGRKPTVILDVRRPALILAAQTKSFILDDTGTAIAEMRQLPIEDRQDLLVLQDQSGLGIEVGSQAVTSGTVAFIQILQIQLAAQGLVIDQLTLPTVANELDIRLEGTAYYVKTDTSGDARLQAGTFLAVRDHLAGQGAAPAEYIDVRVEERAYYR